MRFSRKMIYAAATPLTLAGLLATTAATSASAAVRPLPRHVASGSMALGSPLQYETFVALQGFGRDHGVVNYTNWAYAEPGSGVYAPQPGAHQLTFVFHGAKYAHTLKDGLTLVAKSTDRLAFSGTGFYNGGGITWTITGQVSGDRVTATIAYAGQSYKVFLIGKVVSGGMVLGTARSSTGQVMAFSMPAGTFASVLHYHAAIQSDQIRGRNATFSFTIPKSVAGLAGTKVTVKVHDGGFGPVRDRYAHGVTGTPLSQYPIIGGFGVTVW